MRMAVNRDTGEILAWWDIAPNEPQPFRDEVEPNRIFLDRDETSDEFTQKLLKLAPGDEIKNAFLSPEGDITVTSPEPEVQPKTLKEAFTEMVTEKKLLPTKTMTVADIMLALTKMEE